MSDPDIPQPSEEGLIRSMQPRYVGDLEEAEFNMLRSLQQASSQVVLRIGQLEVQKSNLLQTLRQTDLRAQELMNKAAERLGVEPNQHWNVGPDGRVFVVEE